jgi:hypothetical protein
MTCAGKMKRGLTGEWQGCQGDVLGLNENDLTSLLVRLEFPVEDLVEVVLTLKPPIPIASPAFIIYFPEEVNTSSI